MRLADTMHRWIGIYSSANQYDMLFASEVRCSRVKVGSMTSMLQGLVLNTFRFRWQRVAVTSWDE